LVEAVRIDHSAPVLVVCRVGEIHMWGARPTGLAFISGPERERE